jgi:tetratricopeptide (TPR) repeat protein
MELFEQNLASAPPKSFEWARTNNNIAVALMSQGDVRSVALAEKAYQNALSVYTRSVETAVRWAHLRNVAAAINLEKGGLQNLMQAKSSCEEGLAIVHQDTDPFEWARLQSNLGAINISLYYAGSEMKYVELARQATDRALTVFTREAYPFDRGRALLIKSDIEIVDVPKSALAACKEASEIYALDDYPIEWAITQVQTARCLGAIAGDGNIEEALQRCADAEKKLVGQPRRSHLARAKIVRGNLWRFKLDFARALVEYEEAALICTPDVSPRIWALARFEYARCESIASAAASLTTDAGAACKRLHLAIRSVNDARTVFTKEDYPTNHEATEKFLLGFKVLDLFHGCGEFSSGNDFGEKKK